MHSDSGEMDLYVDGFGYFVQGVKGAFVDANAYLQTTMSSGALIHGIQDLEFLLIRGSV